MRIACLVGLLCLAQNAALATWSVVAVDRGTGRVVISSSTCTGTTDDFLKDVQAVVVPGKGVAACQAGVDSATHQNQTLVFEELKRGTDPARIIEMLSQDPGFQSRQFGIVDLQGRVAGHSGLTRPAVKPSLFITFFPTAPSRSIENLHVMRPGGFIIPGPVYLNCQRRLVGAA